jgi:hypothetical protein
LLLALFLALQQQAQIDDIGSRKPLNAAVASAGRAPAGFRNETCCFVPALETDQALFHNYLRESMPVTNRNQPTALGSVDISCIDDNGSLAAKDEYIEGVTLTGSSESARHSAIAKAAYNRAQNRGFAPGDDWQDWFAAEREIDGVP